MLKCIVIVLCGFPVIGYGRGFAFWVFHLRGDAFTSQALHAMCRTFSKGAFGVLISL